MENKILLTGATGFVGKNIKEKLANRYQIYESNRTQLNLLDKDAIKEYLEEHNIDTVIHAAVCTNVNNCNSEYQILNDNLKMFYNLVECNECYNQMFYFGSGAEYDQLRMPPKVKEENLGEYIPSDPYAFSKYIMAKETQNTNNIYDLTLFGVFGKYEYWPRRFISYAICRCLYNLPIVIRQNVYFDYLYIDDLVEIIDYFITHTPKDKHYNICRGKTIDLYTLATIIKEISGSDVEIIIEKEGLKREYSGDNTRMLQEIGEMQFTGYREAIAMLYEYYVQNKKLIDPQKLQ